MKVLIVEDDFIVADHLSMMLNKYDVKVIDVVDNFKDALSENALKAEVFFLDIRISGEKDGIDIGHELKKRNKKFIYVTANNEVSTLKKAVSTSPLAYITKPYKESDVLAILEMIQNQKHFIVKSDLGKKNIPFDSILYLKADGSYIEIVTTDETFKERNSLNYFEEAYQEELLRVHRSYLVNPKKIEQFTAKHLFINKEAIPISRNYKEIVYKRIKYTTLSL